MRLPLKTLAYSEAFKQSHGIGVSTKENMQTGFRNITIRIATDLGTVDFLTLLFGRSTLCPQRSGESPLDESRYRVRIRMWSAYVHHKGTLWFEKFRNWIQGIFE
jgi:hypothetical protein